MAPRKSRRGQKRRGGSRWGRIIALTVLGGLGGAAALLHEAPSTGRGVAKSEVLSQLERLPVRPRAPKSGYSREQFGQRWADVDGNGCDTRNDVLNRDLSERTWRPGTRDCVVVAGRLHDPYTGAELRFEKANAAAIQIDHVVSLSNAWQTGAQALTPERRTALANDPLNLLAVDGPTNQVKGDADAAEWLTPSPDFRCDYVSRQVQVKTRYGLWTTAPEHEAMRRVLVACANPSP